MGEKHIHLKVHTPAHTVVDAEVDYVVFRAVEGEMGILPSHQPCGVALDIGLLRAFRAKEEVHTLMVMGGFASVGDNSVTVVTVMAEPPDRIQQALEEREAEQAANRLREKSADLEIHRAETALRRTLVQMEVSDHTILRGEGTSAGTQSNTVSDGGDANEKE